MKTKQFVGEVIESQLNEFMGKNNGEPTGEMIETWSLKILLNDDNGRAFSISKRDQGMYDLVKQIPIGARIKVTAVPDVQVSGRVKWKLHGVTVESGPINDTY